MKSGSAPKLPTKPKRIPKPRAPNAARPFDLNYWLNRGRTVDRTSADLLRDSGLLGVDSNEFVYVQNLALICHDGYWISIQCSLYHYCYPRETWADVSYYDSFELGFPNMVDECLLPYIDSPGRDPKRSVYPRVPRAVVEELLAIHGGVQMLDTSQRHFPNVPLLKPGEKIDGDKH